MRTILFARMSSKEKSTAPTGRGTTPKGKTMKPGEIPEKTSAKESIARAVPMGRPISLRLYTELKKKAVTSRLTSKKGRENLPS
ncbi:MAG: hypothetical protein QOG51_1289 [Verrucomicrobiota bacterium]|jgi:hypothetical protein